MSINILLNAQILVLIKFETNASPSIMFLAVNLLVYIIVIMTLTFRKEDDVPYFFITFL